MSPDDIKADLVNEPKCRTKVQSVFESENKLVLKSIDSEDPLGESTFYCNIYWIQIMTQTYWFRNSATKILILFLQQRVRAFVKL